MTTQILFNATQTEKRAAVIEKDKVVELVVERPDQYRIVGNIYRGKVLSVLPGIQSAFMDLGLERSSFLHAADVDPSLLLEKDDDLMERYMQANTTKARRIPKIPIEKVLQVGQEMLVQVLKEPIGTKGAKITTQISIAGRFLVLVPDSDFIGVSKKNSDWKKRKRLRQIITKLKPPGIGFIVRTIGLEVSEEEFIQEIHSLLDKWHKVQEEAVKGHGPRIVHRELGITTKVIRDLFSENVNKVYVDNKEDFEEIQAYVKSASPNMVNRIHFYNDKIPLFEKFNIEKDLDRSLRRKVWLKCGGYILFDDTEALLAIDVNTGRNIGRSSLEQTIFTTNMEAAEEIVRQLRLRDIGGLIVIDFIDMTNFSHRRTLEDKMRTLIKNDPTATSHTGLSKFCLMEITRKRVRPELRDLYTDVCHTCNGTGWVFSPTLVISRIDRWLQRARSHNRKYDSLKLMVHPLIKEHLLKDNKVILNKLEETHKYSLIVDEDATSDQDEFTFLDGNKGNELH